MEIYNYKYAVDAMMNTKYGLRVQKNVDNVIDKTLINCAKITIPY